MHDNITNITRTRENPIESSEVRQIDKKKPISTGGSFHNNRVDGIPQNPYDISNKYINPFAVIDRSLRGTRIFHVTSIHNKTNDNIEDSQPHTKYLTNNDSQTFQSNKEENNIVNDIKPQQLDETKKLSELKEKVFIEILHKKLSSIKIYSLFLISIGIFNLNLYNYFNGLILLYLSTPFLFLYIADYFSTKSKVNKGIYGKNKNEIIDISKFIKNKNNVNFLKNDLLKS